MVWGTSSINVWGSKDLSCNSKPIFLFFISAWALREILIINVKLHAVAQGKADIEYFQMAQHKTVTEEKLLLKNWTVITARFEIACGNLQSVLSSHLFFKSKLSFWFTKCVRVEFPGLYTEALEASHWRALAGTCTHYASMLAHVNSVIVGTGF